MTDVRVRLHQHRYRVRSDLEWEFRCFVIRWWWLERPPDLASIDICQSASRRRWRSSTRNALSVMQGGTLSPAAFFVAMITICVAMFFANDKSWYFSHQIYRLSWKLLTFHSHWHRLKCHSWSFDHHDTCKEMWLMLMSKEKNSGSQLTKTQTKVPWWCPSPNKPWNWHEISQHWRLSSSIEDT